MEHVQTESAVGLPMVHRLEGDQRQPPVDGDLRQGGILHTMRPAPDDLPHKHSARSSVWTLGSRMTSQPSINYSRVQIPPHEFGQLPVVNAIALGIAVFNVHPLT
jgi:hypothetical protein